jgi:hypothetical protein
MITTRRPCNAESSDSLSTCGTAGLHVAISRLTRAVDVLFAFRDKQRSSGLAARTRQAVQHARRAADLPRPAAVAVRAALLETLPLVGTTWKTNSPRHSVVVRGFDARVPVALFLAGTGHPTQAIALHRDGRAPGVAVQSTRRRCQGDAQVAC